MENVKNTNNNLLWASANSIRATAKRPLLARWASGENMLIRNIPVAVP